jgi:hypothetical protein
MLLERPWIHENGIVFLTLHQYFKYIQNGQVRKILIDINPFTIVEVHFTLVKLLINS